MTKTEPLKAKSKDNKSHNSKGHNSKGHSSKGHSKDNNSKNKKRNRAQVPSLNHIGKLPTKLQARATALILFLEVKQGQSLQHLVDQALSQMTPQDRAFTLELLMGSLRFHLPLTLKVRACLKSPLKNQQQWLESVLILGCYQLYKMSVPSRAVIHTMVELVRAFGFDHLTGLINGVLRHLDRHKPDIKNFHDSEFADEEFEPLELFEKPFAIHDYLNVNHWLYTALYQDWKRYFLDIMNRFQQKPSMTLRVNQRKITVADYRSQLMAEGVEICTDAAFNVSHPHALELKKTQNVAMLPGYEFGYFSVQDVSAQAAVQALVNQLYEDKKIQHNDEFQNEQKNEKESQTSLKVLDACAAPGGKTAALLECLPESTSLDAVEIDAARATRIHENLERLELLRQNVRVICADLTQPQPQLDAVQESGGYDAILLDVPCSGTGVIGRHPDIFFCRRQSDITELVVIQRQLLARAELLLKPGGLVLYATCSILKEENSKNIQWYLENTESKLVEIPLSESLGVSQPYGKQRLPLPNQSGDGFYYALLRKHA